MQKCYLLHFDRPLKHASHYIGWTSKFDKRIEHHRNGTGAKITRAAVLEGINLVVARIWDGKDGNFERKLHNYKKTKRLCPICSGEQANERMKS